MNQGIDETALERARCVLEQQAGIDAVLLRQALTLVRQTPRLLCGADEFKDRPELHAIMEQLGEAYYEAVYASPALPAPELSPAALARLKREQDRRDRENAPLIKRPGKSLKIEGWDL